MKVGATEKTFFNIWHPDADTLFNISSDLRRVCWELHDPSLRLEGDDRGITLMQCFQPQLAQFQMHSVQKMVEKMRPTEDDPVFWIEEKLDGERMQLHMVSDDTIAGGKRFAFWSRKAKDYTYLYGNGFFDEQAALTRHVKEAFHEGVENIILDGEMITWDPEEDVMVPFGTLKTAALDLSKNMHSKGPRPLFRVFDILYLNGQALTSYTLRDRRKALEKTVNTIHRRLEVHTYVEAKSYLEVDPLLRKIVQEASEGLVLKNPRSPYRLNERNDDWMKVKPEYMTEYGESLDCIVVGGYYGSGRRGGTLSSFLCGLRVDENEIHKGAKSMKCVSFFKVGGGMTAADYAEIRHRTDGKWVEWNSKRPPSDFVELAGGNLQYERPDVWIRPDESVVVSVKAASVSATDQFKMGLTLRFPRFKKLRTDRDWTSALTINGFLALQKNVEKEKNDKQFKVDDHRRKRQRLSRKKPLTVLGSHVPLKTPYGGPETNVFESLNFCRYMS
jgi:DNA ligase 4